MLVADDLQETRVDEALHDPTGLLLTQADLGGERSHGWVEAAAVISSPVGHGKHGQQLAAGCRVFVPHQGHDLDAHAATPI